MPKLGAHGRSPIMTRIRLFPMVILGFLPFHHPLVVSVSVMEAYYNPELWPPSGHMLLDRIISICRSMQSRADILVWFVYAISLWSNKFSPLPENLSPKRLCVERHARPEIRPPSGHIQIFIITCIRRSMEPRDDLLVWFVNEILS